MGAVTAYEAFADNIGDNDDLDTTALDLEDFDFTVAQITQATLMRLTHYHATGTNICRYAFNGSVPVAGSVGHTIPVNGEILVEGANLPGFSIVSDNANAVITITLFR